jgi:hypothetical protein
MAEIFTGNPSGPREEIVTFVLRQAASRAVLRLRCPTTSVRVGWAESAQRVSVS